MLIPLANTGLPMLFPQVTLMALAFVPIVMAESALAWFTLRRRFWRICADIALANFWTTVAGVPIAWVTMVVVLFIAGGGGGTDIVTRADMLRVMILYPAWLAPYEEHLFWMIPASATGLLLPCFIASVYIEYRILKGRWRDTPPRQIMQVVFRANAWSYLLLFAMGILWLIETASLDGMSRTMPPLPRIDRPPATLPQ